MTLSRISQTAQLSASAVLSNNTQPQDVTGTATWQSSNTAVATVSGGLVTAIAAGTVTIAATYQGNTATQNVSVALGSSVSATIDGVPFNAIEILVRRYSGTQLYLQASSAMTDPHFILTIAAWPTVGTYDLKAQAELTWVSLSETSTGFVWSSDVAGGSGTLNLSTLTSTSASGTFSLTVAPWQGNPTGAKIVTNGVFGPASVDSRWSV
jgi:hypothetical protein